MAEELDCRSYLVSGKVQGVSFRYHTQQQACVRGLVGWVRNLNSGQVEVLACGPKKGVFELGQWLKRGPALASVDNVQEKEWKPIQFSSFTIDETGEARCW